MLTHFLVGITTEDKLSDSLRQLVLGDVIQLTPARTGSVHPRVCSLSIGALNKCLPQIQLSASVSYYKLTNLLPKGSEYWV